MKLSPRQKFLGLWLLWGSVAALACLVYWPAAHLNGEYLPVGNDSFYHARRILDTAAAPASFYEFDTHIHAPEGSLLTWPWGYDYALGWLVRLAAEAGVPGPPMAFLIWVPVAAVFLSIALIMIIARRLLLSLPFTSLGALGVALSPLTAVLHGIGMIDHHYAEYILVLATIASGLTWFAQPSSKRAAIMLGAILGIAPAIHNGLFILQIPVLATIFLLWLQDRRLPLRAALIFGSSLLLTTAMILVPSLPVQLGLFQFYTLSWFHLYVAFGTAAAAALLGYLPRSTRSLFILGCVALLLLAPLGRQFLGAQAFLAGRIERLDGIQEMKSLQQMSTQQGGAQSVSTLYSFLIWLVPLTVLYCALSAWRERNSERLFFWVSCVLGLGLLVTQFRLHYFGSFAIFIPWLICIQRFAATRPMQRRAIFMATSLAFVMTIGFSLRFFYFGAPFPPASDEAFSGLRPVLEELKEKCSTEPGIVLADNDAGHYIRYYTDCPVIANNFLLTRQHEEKIRRVDHLTSLSAAQLSAEAPEVRYLLLRPVNVVRTSAGDVQYISYSTRSAPLLDELLLGKANPPDNFVLLKQADIDVTVQGVTQEVLPLIRLYKIKPAGLAVRTSGRE